MITPTSLFLYLSVPHALLTHQRDGESPLPYTSTTTPPPETGLAYTHINVPAGFASLSSQPLLSAVLPASYRVILNTSAPQTTTLYPPELARFLETLFGKVKPSGE
jgi:hypothetical protein